MAGKGNLREVALKEFAEKEGWEVLGNGWPDFLLFDGKKNRVVLVEVKGAKGSCARLSKNQKRMHRILRRLGFRVEVLRLGKNPRKRERVIENQPWLRLVD